jgi:MFS family permease
MAQTAEVDSPSPSTEPSYTPDPNTIKAASSESTDFEKDGSEKAPGSSALEVATVTEAKSLHFIMTIIFLCMVSAVGSMDSVIVAMCLSSISEDIGTTSVESFWLGTGFLLTQTVTIPIYGTLSDIFGRKPMVLIGVGTFFAASILCATAQNATWLIAARAVQGLGAGGLISLCQVIISDITTMQERGKYITFAAFAWAVGIFLGVPMGGLIAEYTTWRWVFWINLPPCGIAILGLWWSLHLQTDTSSFRSKLARVDYLGLILFTGASCSLLIGITCGGTVNPWNSASTIVPIILSAVLYAAFIVVESKLAVSPMIPLRIFQDRTANSAYIGAFFHGMIVWCFSYYIIVFVRLFSYTN